MKPSIKHLAATLVVGLCLVAGISYWLSGDFDDGRPNDGPIINDSAGHDMNHAENTFATELIPDQPGDAATDGGESSATSSDPWKNTHPIAVVLENLDKLNLSREYMTTHWQTEYGCGADVGSDGCADSPFVARSPEEAVWMYRAGYIPASVEAEVAALSDRELEVLSLNRESSGYAHILARRYSAQGNDKAASDAFLLAQIFALQTDPLNSAVYVDRAEHALNNLGAQPERDQVMRAMRDLQIANLLGDTAAANKLQRIAEDQRYGLTVADIEEVTQRSETFFEQAWIEWKDDLPLPRRP